MLKVEIISRLAIGISTFVEYLVFIKILNCLEERKYKKRYLEIIFLLIGALNAIILFKTATQYYDFMLNLKWVSFILFVKLNYKVSNFKSLLYYLTYTTATYITWQFVFDIAYLIITGGTPYTSTTSESNLNLIFIIENIISMLINISYINIIKKLKSIDKEKINIIIIIGCIISNFSVAFMNSLPRVLNRIKFDFYSEVNGFNINITPRLSFLNSMLLLMVVFKTIKDIKEKSEENLLKEKIDMQYKYYLNLQESQNKVKRLYHDMNNHMLCINSMSADKEDINKYIDNIRKDLKQFKEIYNTGNMILDIILNEKQNICNENNIDLICDINFSKCYFIEINDVCSVFSNILDNAIEACNKVSRGEKYIKVRGTVVKSHYVIMCENSKINKLEIKNNKIITSKKDKFIHGIGLKSVKSSLKKYDGELEIQDFQKKFLLQIYIPLNKNMTVGA
ncbi:ATP-binding protein [Paraclostridium ghonii]|uniref:Sensor histidine kinase YesM n=1 Tax=Paraclostridium ghonii TaxID=29358 RepID=A0ABU0N1Z8_9FIRM|nr:ATP-binding protein [Paeniclostridium ghonii]MDQ0557188.1 sensor histidine kinase YesM [Paeniclostridium ghonii]